MDRLPFCPDTAAQEALAEGSQRRLFFDLLPPGVLTNIVRYVSRRPNRLNWQTFIAANDVTSLYRVGGALSSECVETFQALTVDGACKPSEAGGNELTKEDENHALFLPIVDFRSGFLRYSNAASSVTTFGFTRASLRESFHWSKIDGLELATRCPALRELRLPSAPVAMCRDILSSCSGTLESLHAFCGSYSMLVSIATHCVGLRELFLGCDFNFPRLQIVLTALGPSLEKLHLEGDVSTAQNVEDIAKYCPSLRSIRVSCLMRSVEPKIAELWAFYGKQLEYARTTSLPHSMCRLVANACPNVRVHFDYFRYVELSGLEGLRGLQYLGPRAASVGIEFVHEVKTSAPSFPGLSACVNLKEIHFVDSLHSSSIVQFAPVLFANPLPQLTTLLVCGVNDGACQMIEAIAKGTGGLRKFCFKGRLKSPTPMEELVVANPSLSQIQLLLYRRRGLGGEEAYVPYVPLSSHIVDPISSDDSALLADIVRACAYSPSLRELVVDVMRHPGAPRGVKLECIADACCRLRSRDVHVHVFDIDYIP